MAPRHKVEVFSAGCAICQEAVEEIRREAALSSWEVVLLDMHDPGVAARAKELGIRSVPAVLIDGRIADCSAGGGIDMQILRAGGFGLADLAGLWWR